MATKKTETKQIALTPQVLIAWRERMGYSQRDAVTAIGCSRGAWAGWENGDNEIPRYIGLAIAALALGMDPYGDQPVNQSDE